MSDSSKRQGFTIIELLVVIVIIAILAALVVVGYNGLVDRARTTTLKDNLSSAAKSLMVSSIQDGSYPPDLASTGLTPGAGSTYQYTYTSATNSYCLTGISGSTAYMITSSDSMAIEGVCAGHTGPSVPGGNGGNVTTLAGTSAASFADGSSANARFNTPYGVATDSSGIIYVADYRNHRIRKITQAGDVTTLAGSGVAGFADGTGTSAKFNYPKSVTVDSNGNVYVADYGNNRIRKITSGGVVSTLAGSGVAGFADAAGTSAKFNYPSGVAVDSTGNVYVADTTNHRVRKIIPTGDVTTLAGTGVSGFADGAGASAQFYSPAGVAIDSDGMVYVAESVGHHIRKITPGGVVSTLAGSGVSGFADGTGMSAQFYNPIAVAVDSNKNVYVADSQNHRIRKVTTGGVVTTPAGTGGSGFADGAGASAQFSFPFGVAVDSSGAVYVADSNNNRIRIIR